MTELEQISQIMGFDVEVADKWQLKALKAIDWLEPMSSFEDLEIAK